MFNKIIITTVLFAAFVSCTRVPITGRRQMNLLPESEMMSMSLTSYRDFLSKNKVLPESDSRTLLVKKVGNNIATAVQQFMMANKRYANRVAGFKWEFNCVDDKTINAWCMPGGKVVVYTGLLPITQDESGLAVVLGHEIAHAIARHGNERMSQGLLVQLGGIGLAVATSGKPALTQDIFNQSYGIASGLGTLAYSRKNESEADKLGLVFMAMAGYNPEVAPAFWQRMAASTPAGQKPPEILSTHPSDETRIKDIKAFLPQAMKYYKPN